MTAEELGERMIEIKKRTTVRFFAETLDKRGQSVYSMNIL